MKKENRLWLWISSIVGLALLTWLIVSLATPNLEGSAEANNEDWSKGNPNAKVTLIEYSDFQCPACASYFPLIKKVSEDMSEEVLIIYRHYPLSSIHPQADLAAQATEAAGIQGKFWEMHDKLFENQSDWSGRFDAEAIFVSYAQDLGLDVEQFKNDLDSKTVKDAIKDDKRRGNQDFVEGTPTLFLNGQKINNPKSYDKLRQAIRDEADKIQ